MRVKFGVVEQTQGLHLHAKFDLNVFIVSASGGQKPKCQMSSRSVYSVVLWRRKTPDFFRFFGLRHLVMSPIGINLRKLSAGAQPQTFLSNGIKIVSVLQRLYGDIGRTNSDVQKRDGQTNRQTKKLNVFGQPGGG